VRTAPTAEAPAAGLDPVVVVARLNGYLDEMRTRLDRPAAEELADAIRVAKLAVMERGWKPEWGELEPAEERARLHGAQFRFQARDPASEPFGFYSTRETVVASVSSLKFLDDLCVAAAWLDLSGFEQQTIADYMLVLRYWRCSQGDKRPPKPLDALCIPTVALANRRVEARANRIFDGVVVSILPSKHDQQRARASHSNPLS
jgi:hypothetical protein